MMTHLDLRMARERLCKEAKLRICNMSFPSGPFQFHHNGVTFRNFHYPRLDQSIDAVIYVTVVFVLFAAIILLLVSTGCHKFQLPAGTAAEKRQLVVRFEDGGPRTKQDNVSQEAV